MEYLARAQRKVPVLFEVLRHGDDVRDALPRLVLTDVAADGVRPPPGEEGGPAGPAQSHLGVGLGQDEALGGQSIQVRGLHLRRTEAIALTQHTDIGSTSYDRVGREEISASIT